MINRYIFTDRKPKLDAILDVALACFIGLSLAFAALAYFDVLYV